MYIEKRSEKKKRGRKFLPVIFISLLAVALLIVILSIHGTRKATRIQQAYAPGSAQGMTPVATENTGADSGSTAEETPTEPPQEPFDYTLCFSGDISVADGARTTQYWLDHDKDITQCIDPVMVQTMQNADICFVNNEFQYSTRGSALPGKPFTFRGDPANVSVLHDLGVDIVSLANNHTYDYGEDALLDTLDTLKNANIPYVGAGKDLDEASSIYYYELDGFTVAFLSGTRVEWVEETKGATENSPGVFRTVEPELLYQRTKEASANADYVVVYMHWGVETATYQEEYQTETGHGLIDAGADAVIGDHTHCLQGIEFYNGKPILYSMGNYWFNGKSMDTMLAELHISGTADAHETQLQLIPARQTNCQVIYYGTPEEQSTFFRNMEDLSSAYHISIDENGLVTPAVE